MQTFKADFSRPDPDQRYKRGARLPLDLHFDVSNVQLMGPDPMPAALVGGYITRKKLLNHLRSAQQELSDFLLASTAEADPDRKAWPRTSTATLLRDEFPLRLDAPRGEGSQRCSRNAAGIWRPFGCRLIGRPSSRPSRLQFDAAHRLRHPQRTDAQLPKKSAGHLVPGQCLGDSGAASAPTRLADFRRNPDHSNSAE
ncbi:hypothetical protein [Sphingopyxis fribergensis]|uniref:hypothetical protein n=1 Tax=Sphingopyxis fribergensis TaxID=1515612 RepID=UPI0011DDA62F|nr:hypothetical protein [Sphingopyxis fribergensis]